MTNFKNRITLDKLGQRIYIIGCSNSGKSTLANALSAQLKIPACHLDQYAHVENSKWERNPDELLIVSHNKIIEQNAWIIDGNYGVCMGPRIDLATSVIWLDPTVLSSVWRYLFRSVRNDPNSPGRLAGAKNEFSFRLIKWILFNYPKNRIRYEKLIKNRPDLLLLHIRSMAELKKYYAFWSI